MNAIKKKASMDSLPNLVDNFEIVVLRLCESRSLLLLDGSEIPTKITIQIHIAYSVDAPMKAVRIRCDCNTFTEHEADKPPAVTVSAAYECIYQAKTDKAMDSVEKLIPALSVSAQFHAWPYLRRHIHQASVDMGVPPILLPLFGPRATAKAISKGSVSIAKTKPKAKSKTK